MNMHDAIVRLAHLDLWQGDRQVLADVSFNVNKGELVYLVGKTGQGKSTLLKTLYADHPVRDTGKSLVAEVAGCDLKSINRNAVSQLRRKLGIVFQDFQLFFDRTVADNLTFVMQATGWTDTAKMKHRQAEVLMQVGLGGAANKMPYQLSGGEQQRVVIARALLNEPLLLIADEPTGNLDTEASKVIMEIFSSINHAGTAIVMATHNLQLVKSFPGRILEVHEGMVHERNPDLFSGLAH